VDDCGRAVPVVEKATTVGYVATGDVDMSGLNDSEVPRITRRTALARGAGGLAAAGSLSALLAACGSSSSSGSSSSAASGATSSAAGSSSTSSSAADQGSMTGTMTLLSYPGWYGPHEFAAFSRAHPGLKVKTAVTGTTGVAAQIAQIANNPGAYDLSLAGVPVSSQMKLAGIIEPIDPSAVPNLKLVPQEFRTAFPLGIPTDFGKTGYAYRKDLIPERPTSWKDLINLAPKYSGKITMIKYDSDIQGSFLKALGYSINTKSQDALNAMQRTLLALKPHLQAILETDYSKALIQGTALFAIDYDYDLAAAQQKNKNIVWVPPTEGMAAYLEGWVALKGTKHLGAVWDLMNFHLAPQNYASFINSTGSAFVEPNRFIDKSIVGNPSLKYTPGSLSKVEFEQYLGPQQVALRGKLWEEFLAA
jgi:spermidine/putrescine transport system substrate-binding protein